jgi:hypothetical protein
MINQIFQKIKDRFGPKPLAVRIEPHLPFLRMRDYAPIYPINQNDSKIKWEKFSQTEI